MKIVVNYISVSDGGGGMVVLQDLYKTIRDKYPFIECVFLLGHPYISETENIKVLLFPRVKQSYIRRVFFDLFSGKKIINKLKPDILLSLQNTPCYGVHCKQYVYLHQPLPFQEQKSFSFIKKEERALAFRQHIIGTFIKKTIQKANGVFVQTNWMRDAVEKKTNIMHDRIFVVTPTVSNINYQCNKGVKNNEFFYPTSNTLYKNIKLIEEAAKLLHEKKYIFNVEITIDSRNQEIPGISYIGHIPRDFVLQKYCEKILVFPSYIETFGYPLAEARQLGTIILASDCPFAREVLDGYENAFFFDCMDATSLADVMRKVIEGKITKKNISNLKKTDTVWSSMIDTMVDSI